MGDDPDVGDLMVRLRSGDESAATEVFRRFRVRLIRLAQSRLDVELQHKVEPEDVVQSAFRSFFRRQRADSFDIADWDNLWSLLAVITINKCGHQIRYYRAECRNTQREQSIFRFTEESAAGWEIVSREPTPSHAAQLTECLRELLQTLSERECQIVTLCLQGMTVREICDEAKCSQRTVQRVLERVRSLLEEQSDAAD